MKRNAKKKVKKVITSLKKASKAHAGQAKYLTSALKNLKKKNKKRWKKPIKIKVVFPDLVYKIRQ